MRTWPQNVARFKIDSIPMDELDQKMLRKFRKIADQTGWTVADHIHEAAVQYAAKREAEKKLETKIIRFPSRCAKPTSKP